MLLFLYSPVAVRQLSEVLKASELHADLSHVFAVCRVLESVQLVPAVQFETSVGFVLLLPAAAVPAAV